MKSINFERYSHPENCQAFRDQTIEAELASLQTEFNRKLSPQSIANMKDIYDGKFPKIEEPNCYLEQECRDLLIEIAPGLDLDQLDQSIANLDWKNIKVSELQKSKIIKLALMSIPAMMASTLPIAIFAGNLLKGLSIDELTAKFLGGGVTSFALISLAVGAKLDAITNSTYPKTAQEITHDLEDFFRSEGIKTE